MRRPFVADGDCCSSTCTLDPAGSPCTDDQECTDDACDGAGRCVPTPVTGRPCDDGVFCNGADHCAAGFCTVHAGDPCVGGGECHDLCLEHFDLCGAVDGSPCTDDGNPCTLDRCNFRAGCGHLFLSGCSAGCPLIPTPAASCKQPTRPRASRIVLQAGTVTRDAALSWRWAKGETTAAAELGDPLATHAYSLCVYDESGPMPSLLFQASALPGGTCPTKPCWKAQGTPPGAKGFRYLDPERTPNGLERIRLVPGEAGKSKAVVKGKGDLLLALPPGPFPLPLRAQLRSAFERVCFEATYSAVVTNDTSRLVAQSD